VLLSIDTSTLTLSLALVVRSSSGAIQVIEHFNSGPPKKQSEMLPGAIRDLISRHGIALSNLQGIAIGLGPGSFTGLRIGLATAKGISYAARIPLVGVSSLAAVASEGPEGSLLVPTAPARQGELYIGEYRRRAELVEAVGPERAVTPGDLADLLRRSPQAVALGPGVAAYQERLRILGVADRQIVPLPLFPSAAAIALLAPPPQDYDARSIFAMEPHYIRLSPPENAALPPNY
jgi:tRNA threonylcarbamoyladenosine biosynthesis protein TsaB